MNRLKEGIVIQFSDVHLDKAFLIILILAVEQELLVRILRVDTVNLHSDEFFFPTHTHLHLVLVVDLLTEIAMRGNPSVQRLSVVARPQFGCDKISPVAFEIGLHQPRQRTMI